MRPAAVLLASSLICGLLVDHLALFALRFRAARPWWLPVDPS